MRTSIGFALGTLFSLIVMSANAAGTSVVAPAKVTAQADVEVIVVTAKRPAMEATIEEIVVTAKRPTPSTVTGGADTARNGDRAAEVGSRDQRTAGFPAVNFAMRGSECNKAGRGLRRARPCIT